MDNIANAALLYSLLNFDSPYSYSCSTIKSAAKTGLIIWATSNEASKATIKVMGKYTMNSPMMPGQNAKGMKGASTTSVPVSTGTNTSPAANFAALRMGTFPLP